MLHNFFFETFFFLNCTPRIYISSYRIYSLPSIRFFDEYLFTSKWIQWKCRYVVATSGSDR